MTLHTEEKYAVVELHHTGAKAGLLFLYGQSIDLFFTEDASEAIFFTIEDLTNGLAESVDRIDEQNTVKCPKWAERVRFVPKQAVKSLIGRMKKRKGYRPLEGPCYTDKDVWRLFRESLPGWMILKEWTTTDKICAVSA